MIFNAAIVILGGLAPQGGNEEKIFVSYFDRLKQGMNQYVKPGFGQIQTQEISKEGTELKVVLRMKEDFPRRFTGRGMIDIHLGLPGKPKEGRVVVGCLGTSGYRTQMGKIAPGKGGVVDTATGRVLGPAKLSVDGRMVRLTCARSLLGTYPVEFGVFRIIPASVSRSQLLSLNEVPEAFFVAPEFAGRQVVIPGVEDY